MKAPLALRFLVLTGSLLVSAAACLSAPLPSKGGIVVVGSSATGSNEFAQAFEFASVETFGMTSTFTFANGTTQQLQPPLLRKTLSYPDYPALTLVTEADWLELDKIAKEAEDVGRQYPKATSLAKALVDKIAFVRQKGRQGNVVVAGQWMSAQDYQQKHTDAKVDYMPLLDLGGKIYKNVRLSVLKDQQMKIMHDGGFSTVEVADLKKLPEADRKALAKTNPRLAPVLGFSAADVGSSAGSVAAAAGNDASRPTTFSYAIVGDTVTITRIGGQEQYAIDKVPQALLTANADLAQAVKEKLAKKGR
ncbi:MAG: hypothetical protein ACAI34_21975 [Verrucomicrobium sp.]|nr:hypothetical protein [Verrucomicrobium sp.]